MSSQVSVLSADDRAALVEGFASLEEEQPGLSERLIRYLESGEGEEVLTEVALPPRPSGPPNATQPRYHFKYEGPYAWDPLLDQPTKVPAGVLLRLAKTIAAIETRDAVVLGRRRNRPDSASINSLQPQGQPHWLKALIEGAVATPLHHNGLSWENRLPAETIERILDADGQPSDLIFRDVFPRKKNDPDSEWAVSRYAGLRGYAERLALQTKLVSAALTDSSSNARALAVRRFEELEIPIASYLDQIAMLAVDSARTVREAAASLIIKAGDEMLPALRSIAESAKPTERGHALQMIAQLGTKVSKAYLQARAGTETQASVRKVLAELLGTGRSPEPEYPEPAFDFDVFAGVALSDSTRDTLAGWAKDVAEEDLDEAFRWLVQPSPWESDPRPILAEAAMSDFDALKALLQRPEMTPLQLVRLLRLCDLLPPGQHQPAEPERIAVILFLCWHFGDFIAAYRDSHQPRMGLRELASAFAFSALDPELIAQARFQQDNCLQFDWEAEAVWPFFASRLDIVARELDPPPKGPRDESTGILSPEDRRKQALAVIAAFPTPPARFVARLWEIALGTSKTDRPLAQRSLEKLPECGERLLKALSSSKAQERTAAVEWVVRLRPEGAVEALQTAFQAERSAPVKTALAEALRALGSAVHQDEPAVEDARENLDKEASKVLKGGIPDKYAWFPFDKLPEVRWRSDQTPVERPVLSGLIVSAWKTNSAEPTVLVRDLVNLIHEDDRQRLGAFVLDAWLAEDLRPPSLEVLQKRLGKYLQSTGASTMDELAQTHSWFAKTVELAKNRPMSSRTEDKGLLALVAACGPKDVAERIRSYVNQWYGYRVSQCRALIHVLAWIDHPEAVAFLLDVARRFRTASIRQEAETQARKLAERKGVTLAELADESLPDAGLDAEGKLVLDFGPRKFVARLDDDAEIVLEDAAGNVLKALPAPGKSDDPDLAAAAKERLAALKKELNTIRKRVVDRLHEAMCTQRAWKFAGWKSTLLDHPIAGRLCQRVVWTVKEKSQPASTFRPLEDGTLTDLDDNEVQPAADATVRIAHRMMLPYKTAGRWAVHMADFDIEPLLSQLGQRPFRLPKDSRSETSLSLPLDPPLTVKPLTNRARARGYDPRAFRLEDGGDSFVKHFPGAQLRAEIRITDLDGQEKATGLELLFLRADAGKDSRGSPSVPLGELPPVLLSECNADLLSVAGAAGRAGLDDQEEEDES